MRKISSFKDEKQSKEDMERWAKLGIGVQKKQKNDLVLLFYMLFGVIILCALSWFTKAQTSFYTAIGSIAFALIGSVLIFFRHHGV